MLIDKIENCYIYKPLSKRIAAAFEYINQTDLSSLKPGKYIIDNEDIFALVQEYDTKNKNEGKLEGHYQYIDLQYIIKGVELIGTSLLTDQKIITNNPEADYAFYEGEPDFHTLTEGMFAIFFPHDLHMPGISVEQPSKVKKLVIKIKTITNVTITNYE